MNINQHMTAFGETIPCLFIPVRTGPVAKNFQKTVLNASGIKAKIPILLSNSEISKDEIICQFLTNYEKISSNHSVWGISGNPAPSSKEKVLTHNTPNTINITKVQKLREAPVSLFLFYNHQEQKLYGLIFRQGYYYYSQTLGDGIWDTKSGKGFAHVFLSYEPLYDLGKMTWEDCAEIYYGQRDKENPKGIMGSQLHNVLKFKNWLTPNLLEALEADISLPVNKIFQDITFVSFDNKVAQEYYSLGRFYTIVPEYYYSREILVIKPGICESMDAISRFQDPDYFPKQGYTTWEDIHRKYSHRLLIYDLFNRPRRLEAYVLIGLKEFYGDPIRGKEYFRISPDPLSDKTYNKLVTQATNRIRILIAEYCQKLEEEKFTTAESSDLDILEKELEAVAKESDLLKVEE